MISYGSCAAAIPETRGIPLPTTPRSRPGDDIVSRLERKHSRVSPIVLRNDNPEVWAKPNKTAKVLRARESVKRTRVPIDPTPIIAAYQAGQSISAIARAQKRAQDTITNVLRANGIPTRRAAPPASVDEATRAAIIASTKAGATEVSTKSRERCPVHGDPQEADARESVGESCACKRRLSPEFVSWMMGLPAGWVTDLGLTRNEELKILGNGVVRQQAAAATRAWVCDMRAERAA